jgi:uncharacterized protein
MAQAPNQTKTAGQAPRRPLRALVEAHRKEIKAVVSRNKGRRVRVFGSVARGDEGPQSDIDFLVDFEKGSSLFDLLHIMRELEELLGRPVDVVSRGGLKPYDQDILDEAIDL